MRSGFVIGTQIYSDTTAEEMSFLNLLQSNKRERQISKVKLNSLCPSLVF